jgi:hypothetical protein
MVCPRLFARKHEERRRQLNRHALYVGVTSAAFLCFAYDTLMDPCMIHGLPACQYVSRQ